MHEAKLLDFRHFRGVQTVENFFQFYKWSRLLGAGAFGEVHEAENLKSGMICAVKVMNKRKAFKTRKLLDQVKQELQVLQSLEHPHIVHVLELLMDDTNLYFVMELIEHGDLMEVHEKIVKNNWSWTERDCAGVIKQILMALNYMH